MPVMVEQPLANVTTRDQLSLLPNENASINRRKLTRLTANSLLNRNQIWFLSRIQQVIQTLSNSVPLRTPWIPHPPLRNHWHVFTDSLPLLTNLTVQLFNLLLLALYLKETISVTSVPKAFATSHVSRRETLSATFTIHLAYLLWMGRILNRTPFILRPTPTFAWIGPMLGRYWCNEQHHRALVSYAMPPSGSTNSSRGSIRK